VAYIVTAAYATVETNVGPGRARVDVPRGQQLPADVPAEDLATVLRLGQVVEVPDFDEPPTPDEPPADEVPDAAIPVVMAWVDGDPDRAVRALTFEQGKGERARSTLVADLTALIQQP
jgi:hypothetical protein